MKAILFALVFMTTSAFAEERTTCFPKKRKSFFEVIVPLEFLPESASLVIQQRLSALYAQEIAAAGGQFQIFESETMDFGAFAYRDQGVFYVELNKGMRYNPRITPDSYAVVACHEIGHHIGGIPLTTGTDWVSVEGQADYYGTLKCMRRYLESLPPAELNDSTPVELEAVALCQAANPSNATNARICARSLAATRALGAVLADLNEEPVPSLQVSDLTQVNVTVEGHPHAQCRVDTYRAGALCAVDTRESVSYTDVNAGVCHPQRDGQQKRPACWFADRPVTLAAHGS